MKMSHVISRILFQNDSNHQLHNLVTAGYNQSNHTFNSWFLPEQVHGSLWLMLLNARKDHSLTVSSTVSNK